MSTEVARTSVISVRDLGVRYKVYRSSAQSLRRTFLQLLVGRWRHAEFWALRGVTFDLHQGETLGVVGPNGAGKSTLCLAMAEIIPPDAGEVVVRGAVAPILSLAAGSRKDLTGRANLFLCGALMGLDIEQIKAIEEPVISFAELEEFIDNPVRTYSSGMRARLAFAIATSVTPDVLILDEVLSVGDAAFRKKSAARMRGLMGRARAIVLVSHSSETIRELCDVVLWLHKGQVRAYGPAAEVLRGYEDWQLEHLKETPKK